MKHRILAGIALLGLSAAAWLFVPTAIATDSEAALSACSGPWGPFFFIGAYVLATVAGIPGSLLTAAGGALFGAGAGALWSLLGATLGAVASFAIARYLFSDLIRSRAGVMTARVIAGVEASGWRFVAIARLIPLVPFNALNYALGLTRIPIASYAITTLVCMA